MAAKKGNSQAARARKIALARQAAEEARRRQVRTRRLSIGAAVAVVAAVGVLAVIMISSGGGGSAKAASPSSTSTPSSEVAGSAAGKPCVPAADPLPAGAPAVPVKVGPPPTNLVTEDLKPGTGAVVAATDSLTVNYIGVSCSTGKIFDSSYKTGKPASFPLSGVIPGWQKGIPGMKVGGQRLLGIPPADGYGDQGSGADIAPGESLWFVVEVVEAKAG